MWILQSCLLALCVVVCAMGLFKRVAVRCSLLDIPNERSAHHTPVPRGAGIIWLLIWSFVLTLEYVQHTLSLMMLMTLLPTVAIVTIVGFVDDCWTLSIQWRLGIQCLVAIQFVVALYGTIPYFSSIALYGLWPILSLGVILVIAIMWSINLFNFMDGLDGLAALEACFVFGMGGWFLWQIGATTFAYLSWLIVTMSIGFLVWNFPPARLFMGDAGSYLLGFLIAAWIVISWYHYQMPIVLWFILYGFFIVDATVTLLRRIYSREKWYQAHHYQAIHRLYRGGWTHRQILGASFLVNSALAGLAFLGYTHPHDIMHVTLTAFFGLFALYSWVEVYYPIVWSKNDNSVFDHSHKIL